MFADSTQLTLLRCRLASNYANIGGGSVFSSDTTLTTAETVFQGNQATGLFPKGGAVLAIGGTAWAADSCVFSENRAQANPSLALGDSPAAFAAAPGRTGAAAGAKGRGEFVDTFGADSGGAVFAEGGADDPVAISLRNCTFARGYARQGGAVATFGDVSITSDASLFSENSARVGGVFFLAAGAVNVTLSEACRFEQNEARRAVQIVAYCAPLQPGIPACSMIKRDLSTC